MPGVEVKIVDERMEEVAPCEEGRLLVIGENVALGYWNDPALSEQHFLVEGKTRQLLTNDIFIQDSEGLLYYQHRTDDVIKSGGYRISIREITRLVQSMENVSEVLILPYTHEVYGTLMRAFVVPYQEEKNFERWLRKELLSIVENSFMVPSIIEIVSEIPKNHHLKPARNSCSED
jgi:long-chain acyl-CoA synthetase